MKIKPLHQADWKIWKQLRLEALKKESSNFGSSFEEESTWPDSSFQDCLIKNTILGAFVDDELVGCVGFYCLNSSKTKHRGIIWGIFTKPEYRGQGIASSLIKAIIAYAQSRVMQLHLTCVTTNLGAIKLYQKHGFKIYATEPRSLKIGDAFLDEHLMILLQPS